MQKAYAAFAAADHATSAGTVEAELTLPESSTLQPDATVETQTPVTSMEAGAAFTEEEPVAPISNLEPAAVPDSESSPAAVSIEATQTSDFARPDENSGLPAELTSRRETEFVAPAETDPSTAASPTASTEAPALVAENSEPKLDSEAVKTTAEAWANWRQIRDTSPGNDELQPQPAEFVAPESALADTAARAVAAGAEQALQEVSSAPSDGPTDVASIVDSVLAGLRPKLMEEITRKMAEKK
jgi:hypothetical protein